MERRSFTFGLGALFAAPALPIAAAAPMSAAITEKFATAKLLARCHDRASPEMLKRLMRLDDETANGLFRLLKDRQVVAPSLDGITRAVNPLNGNCVPTEALRSREFAQAAVDLKSKLRDIAKRRLDPTQAQDEIDGPDGGLPDPDDETRLLTPPPRT